VKSELKTWPATPVEALETGSVKLSILSELLPSQEGAAGVGQPFNFAD
jgi:hypothetical protein